MISLKDKFKEDAEEVRAILEMFSSPGKKDAQIISFGKRKEAGND
jgi:hypothetical protein